MRIFSKEVIMVLTTISVGLSLPSRIIHFNSQLINLQIGWVTSGSRPVWEVRWWILWKSLSSTTNKSTNSDCKMSTLNLIKVQEEKVTLSSPWGLSILTEKFPFPTFKLFSQVDLLKNLIIWWLMREWLNKILLTNINLWCLRRGFLLE